MVPPCFAGLPALSNLPANHGLGDDYAALDAFTVRLGREVLRRATRRFSVTTAVPVWRADGYSSLSTPFLLMSLASIARGMC